MSVSRVSYSSDSNTYISSDIPGAEDINEIQNNSISQNLISTTPTVDDSINIKDIKSTSNQFIPVDIYSSEECSKPGNNFDAVMSYYSQLPNAALSALKMNGLMEMIVKSLSDISDEVLNLMDEFSVVISDMAKNLVEITKTHEKEALEEALNQTWRSGLIGLIMGLIEVVAAVVTVAFTGMTGIGGVAAVIMFADGIVKLSASIKIMSDPSSAGGALLQMQNSGIFAVFDQIGEGGGQIAMMSFSIFMGFGALLEAGVSLVSSAANLGRNVATLSKNVADSAKLGATQGFIALASALRPVMSVISTALLMASSIMRLVGLLMVMVKQLGDEASTVSENANKDKKQLIDREQMHDGENKASEKSSQDKKQLMDTTQAMSMGLAGFIAYEAMNEIMSSTGIREWIEGWAGEVGDMVIEIIAYTIFGMIGDAAFGKMAVSPLKLPDNALASSAAMAKLRTSMQSIGTFSQGIQTSNQVQAYMLAKQQYIFTNEKTYMQLHSQIIMNEKGLFEEIQKVQNDIYTTTSENIQDIANTSNMLIQGILALLRQVDRANVRYG